MLPTWLHFRELPYSWLSLASTLRVTACAMCSTRGSGYETRISPLHQESAHPLPYLRRNGDGWGWDQLGCIPRGDPGGGWGERVRKERDGPVHPQIACHASSRDSRGDLVRRLEPPGA